MEAPVNIGHAQGLDNIVVCLVENGKVTHYTTVPPTTELAGRT